VSPGPATTVPAACTKEIEGSALRVFLLGQLPDALVDPPMDLGGVEDHMVENGQRSFREVAKEVLRVAHWLP
jgi:hypothetical protein